MLQKHIPVLSLRFDHNVTCFGVVCYLVYDWSHVWITFLLFGSKYMDRNLILLVTLT